MGLSSSVCDWFTTLPHDRVSALFIPSLPCNLFQTSLAEHRVRLALNRLATGVCLIIFHLDQQPPFLLSLRDARERTSVFQFLSLQPNVRVAFVERFLDRNILVIFLSNVPIRAFVPNQNRAGAIFVLRDDAFEPGVIKRMIFSCKSRALDPRIGGWALRDGPRFQHAFHLEPKIVVQTSCVMFLNHEDWLLGRLLFLLARRLRRGPKVSLGLVFFQRCLFWHDAINANNHNSTKRAKEHDLLTICLFSSSLSAVRLDSNQ